jgi:hypothetical protein
MTINDPATENRALLAIHLFVIALAALLISYITYDALNNISFISSEGYLKAQFWICILFILSIVAEMVIKRHFTTWEWISHFLFLIICVPYLSIIVHYDIQVSPQVHYFLRFVPVIRAVYALSIVTGAMSKSWIKGLFFSYLMILVASIYFGSMMFYLEEHYVNTAVTDYWTALYWACMDLTTCGSAINAITPIGKILAVVLAAEGLMLFPVFCVYVTDAVTHSKPTMS